jgi:hypothetical protein
MSEFAVPAERLLLRRLPLEDVSPFAVLPDPGGSERSDAAVEAARAREAARAAAGVRTPSSVEAGRTAPGEAAVPAFSFRRPGPGSRIAERGAAAKDGGAPMLERGARGFTGAPGADWAADSGSQAPELARNVIRAAGSEESGRQGGVSAGAPAARQSPAAGTAAAHEQRAVREGTTAEAARLRAAAGGSPMARATKAAATGQPAIALAGALADEILTAERKAANAGGSGGAAGQAIRPAADVTVEERTASEARGSHDWTRRRPPAADAEELAELVNDVLAEQARRHGVDLS